MAAGHSPAASSPASGWMRRSTASISPKVSSGTDAEAIRARRLRATTIPRPVAASWSTW